MIMENKAIEIYRNLSLMLEAVWILYDNQPGLPGWAIGVFSREDRAKSCSLI